MKLKAPCLACPDKCEAMRKLMYAYHKYKDDLPITRVGLRCPKTNEEYERRIK